MEPRLGTYLHVQAQAWEYVRHESDLSTMHGVRMESWTQAHSDTSLGFDRPGGQSVTRAVTVLVQINPTSDWYVFHGGQFAYYVSRPTQELFDRHEARNLPGQVQFEENPEKFDQAA